MSYPSYPPYDSYGGGDEYADPDEAGGSGLDDPDEAGGGDGSGTGGGHPDWPPNLKLKAIRNVRARVDKARADLAEGWVTASQTIPSATDPDGVNPVIVTGGGSAESLKTALDTEAWDSPAAEDYRTWVTEGIDAITTMLDDMIADLTTARTGQESDPGERAEPGSAEATWPAADGENEG